MAHGEHLAQCRLDLRGFACYLQEGGRASVLLVQQVDGLPHGCNGVLQITRFGFELPALLLSYGRSLFQSLLVLLFFLLKTLYLRLQPCRKGNPLLDLCRQRFYSSSSFLNGLLLGFLRFCAPAYLRMSHLCKAQHPLLCSEPDHLVIDIFVLFGINFQLLCHVLSRRLCPEKKTNQEEELSSNRITTLVTGSFFESTRKDARHCRGAQIENSLHDNMAQLRFKHT